MSRQAMQQALEALEWNYGTDLNNIANCEQWAKMLKETITALKQALLIDVSPAQMAHADAVAEPEQPVAWADDVGAVIPHSHKLFAPDLCEKYTRPLYAAPTPRKPLTDAEIQSIWAKTFEMGSSANTFARAIERAHGITGEQHGS